MSLRFFLFHISNITDIAGGAVEAGFQDAARFFGILPHAMDSAIDVGRDVYGRVISGMNGFAAGQTYWTSALVVIETIGNKDDSY